MYARYFKIENDIIQYDKNKIKFTDMNDKLYIKNVIKDIFQVIAFINLYLILYQTKFILSNVL